MPQFLYPKHNYLGPGNPLENGPPVDEADRIAKVHDKDYDNATNSSDVRLADTVGIHKFGKDVLNSPNLPSLAGFVGLSLKRGFEDLIGKTIYPNLE
jgi:hypothetical protein